MIIRCCNENFHSAFTLTVTPAGQAAQRGCLLSTSLPAQLSPAAGFLGTKSPVIYIVLGRVALLWNRGSGHRVSSPSWPLAARATSLFCSLSKTGLGISVLG